jgi:PAS domain S-box-containing protein
MPETRPFARIDRLALLVFAATSVGIALGGISLGQREQRRDLDVAYEQLSAVAQLKARQISEWRQERQAGARALADWPGFAPAVQRWLGRPDDPRLSEDVRRYLTASRDNLGYVDVQVCSTAGRLLSASPHGPTRPDDGLLHLVREAADTRRVVISEMHRADGLNVIDVVAPILDADGRSTAALVVRSDSNRSLAPLLQSWPVASRTAETLLLAREGDTVLFLTNPKGRPGTALELRVPLTQIRVAAVQAALGTRGRWDGVDEGGNPVVADLRAIPDSPWLLVAEIHTSEALAGASARDRAILAFVLLTIALTGTALFAVNRKRQLDTYRALYEAQLERDAVTRHYEFVLRYAPDVVLLSDNEGTIIDVNERANDTYGYRVEELRGQHVSVLRAPGSQEAFRNQWESLPAADPAVFETVHRRRDGTLFPVEVSARLITLDGRRYRHAIVRDITVRKQAEEALRASEARYRLLFNSSNDAIFVCGIDERGMPARFVEVNDEACTRLGYTREELLRLSPLDIDAPSAHDTFTAMMERLQATGQAVWEGAHVTKDGRVIPVEISNHMFEWNGQPAALASVRDISERKQAERELRASQEQFLQAQKMLAVGQLAGGVAHDFNNILSVIINYADFGLEDLPEGSPLHEHFSQIRAAGERAAKLTGQLLAFSRRQVFEPQAVDLNEIVRRMEPMLTRLIGEDLHLTTVYGPDVLPVTADPSQLEQVVMNLVVNARDAMPSGGTLVIETANVTLDAAYASAHPGSRPGPHAALSVSDNGHGMDEATRARVFEPFFTTKPHGKGTGLGLATVYGIVKQSGGSIYVYSEVGRGTTFRIYLPASAARSAAATVSGTASRRSGGTERILLVEDDEAVRSLAHRVLSTAGYRVVCAATGAEAIAAYRTAAEPFDLLVTDVVMPEMSGKQVADRLHEIHPGLKVLFVSGYAENAIVHQGILDANIEFLGKPFTALDLTGKVREVLDKG